MGIDSPTHDGRWIAYQSDQSGRAQIYVRGFPDFEEEHHVSIDGGTEPLWATNGSELFYRSFIQARVTASACRHIR